HARLLRHLADIQVQPGERHRVVAEAAVLYLNAVQAPERGAALAAAGRRRCTVLALAEVLPVTFAGRVGFEPQIEPVDLDATDRELLAQQRQQLDPQRRVLDRQKRLGAKTERIAEAQRSEVQR